MCTSTVCFTIPLILPIFFVVFIVFIIFIASQATKKKQGALKRLAMALPGKMERFSLLPSFSGQYQGLKFTINFITAGEHSPEKLRISLEKNSSFRLSIYEESALSQLGEKLGIIREVRTGDELFDRRFLIFSNKEDRSRAYLNNTSVKETIKRLFNRGFTTFTVDGKRAVIQKPGYVEADLEPSKVISALQDLTLLARGL